MLQALTHAIPSKSSRIPSHCTPPLLVQLLISGLGSKKAKADDGEAGERLDQGRMRCACCALECVP